MGFLSQPDLPHLDLYVSDTGAFSDQQVSDRSDSARWESQEVLRKAVPRPLTAPSRGSSSRSSGWLNVTPVWSLFPDCHHLWVTRHAARVGRQVYISPDAHTGLALRAASWAAHLFSISKSHATFCKRRPESQRTASRPGKEGQGEEATRLQVLSPEPTRPAPQLYRRRERGSGRGGGGGRC